MIRSSAYWPSPFPLHSFQNSKISRANLTLARSSSGGVSYSNVALPDVSSAPLQRVPTGIVGIVNSNENRFRVKADSTHCVRDKFD